MRKLKNFWQNIPRQLRAAGNSLLVLLLAVTFYVCIGSPTLTERQAFRRAEKANQVGPSIILLDADTENYDFEHLILAETEQGVITYASSDTWTPVFCYHEKTGDVTVVTAPEGPFGWGYSYYALSLPVFVVDDIPAAVRAELKLDIVGTCVINLNGERLEIPVDHHYALESTREADGFFEFFIELPFLGQFDSYGRSTDAEHGADGYALDLLAETFSGQSYYYEHYYPRSSASITATVRLYGKSGDLITERDLVLRQRLPET